MRKLGYPGLSSSTLGSVGGQIFYPTWLPNLSAWYDLSDTSSVLGAGGAAITNGAGVSLLADKSGNSGTNCFISTGTASNTATSPNKSLTGSVTFTADVELNSYSDADKIIFTKRSGNDGITAEVLTNGFMRMTVGNGTNAANVVSDTQISTLSAFQRATLQWVWTDGVGGTFFVNGVQLGGAVAAVRTLTNAATTATIGSTNCAGKIYSLTVGSVYNFAPSSASKLASSFVAPTTGETWTINTSGDLGARISGARDLVQLTVANQPIFTLATKLATFNGTTHYLKSPAFSLIQPETVYFVGKQVSWSGSGCIIDGGGNNSGLLEQYASGVSPQIAQYAGSYGGITSGLSINTAGIITSVINGASSFLRINLGSGATGNPGASGMNGVTLGSRADGTRAANITFSEALIYAAAHDLQTQNQIIGYEGAKWAIAV